MKPYPARACRAPHAALLLAGSLALAACSNDASTGAARSDTGTADIPIVLGPVTGGIRTGEAFGTSLIELAPGYIEEEFIIQGTATGFGNAAGSTAPYATRILVRRPLDADDFNGTAIVEWNNVTLQQDIESGWIATADMLMPRGYVYVSVSAQRQGVDGSPLGLFFWDPARYGSLSHPGDDYSWDIFSQAAQALLDPKVLGAELRGRLQRRIAIGASQSGSRLGSYINEVHESAQVFDGFIPKIIGTGNVRKDIGRQLWVLSQDEAALVSEPPEDTHHFRYWEIAGPPHTSFAGNSYIYSVLVYNHVTAGLVNLYDPLYARQYGERDLRGNCTFNRYPVGHPWSAAIVAMDEWLQSGTPPASMPRLSRDDSGSLQFDEHGNALGGYRSPVVDVPLAAYYAGTLPPVDTLTPCAPGGAAPLLGTSATFNSLKLLGLYDSHEDYLQQLEAAADTAVAAGHLLPEHHDELMRYARAADVTDPVGGQIPSAPAIPPIPIPGLPPLALPIGSGGALPDVDALLDQLLNAND